MTLSDIDIDRYSRQILVPDVGGAGQVRLLGMRALVVGVGPAAAVARELLHRAGVGTGEPCDVVVAVGTMDVPATRSPDRPHVTILAGQTAGTNVVATLPGRVCSACVPHEARNLTTPARPVGAIALGALAAATALRALIAPLPIGQLLRLAEDGTATASAIGANRECTACGIEG